MKKLRIISKDTLKEKILKLLCKGLNQQEIQKRLSASNQVSLSTIEKVIKSIKKDYKVKSLCQLGYEVAKKELNSENQ